MPELPDPINTTLHQLEKDEIVDYGREHWGISGLGNKCLRALQYAGRKAYKKTTSQRGQRIFDTGHRAEVFIVADLERIGIKCMKVLKEQVELIGFAGHWKGHPDGFGLNIPEAPKTPHLLEFKTHNDKSFKELEKSGVQASKPTHYDQVQRYMDLSDTTRTLYVGYNKNTSEYYIERIREDKSRQGELREKEKVVLMSETLLKRLSDNPTWYECKFCNAHDVCFGLAPVAKNCRTCAYGDMHDAGVWKCAKTGMQLSFEEQMKGCEKYQLETEMFGG